LHYGVTVIADVPLFVPDVAVIVAVPALLPVTRPLALTDAVAPALDVHMNVKPLIVLPCASFPVAVS
jgi:hypothetical protein